MPYAPSPHPRLAVMQIVFCGAHSSEALLSAEMTLHRTMVHQDRAVTAGRSRCFPLPHVLVPALVTSVQSGRLHSSMAYRMVRAS